LSSGGGDDVLAGGNYDDLLDAGAGSDLIDARGGDDTVAVRGRALVIGGAGDDRIDHRGEAAVVAFNPGDGDDTVLAAGALTLSIGGGVSPGDLTLAQDGADLVLGVAGAGSIRLTREGEDDPSAWPEIRLQLFGSVHLYDFNAALGEPLGAQFAERLAAHEISYSESAGLGGAIAWNYATGGSTGGLSSDELRALLADPRFATAPQPIVPEPPNRPPELAQPLADQSVVEGGVYVRAARGDFLRSGFGRCAQLRRLARRRVGAARVACLRSGERGLLRHAGLLGCRQLPAARHRHRLIRRERVGRVRAGGRRRHAAIDRPELLATGTSPRA